MSKVGKHKPIIMYMCISVMNWLQKKEFIEILYNFILLSNFIKIGRRESKQYFRYKKVTDTKLLLHLLLKQNYQLRAVSCT